MKEYINYIDDERSELKLGPGYSYSERIRIRIKHPNPDITSD